MDGPVLSAPTPVVTKARYHISPERFLPGLVEHAAQRRRPIFFEFRGDAAHERQDPDLQLLEHDPNPGGGLPRVVAVEHGVVRVPVAQAVGRLMLHGQHAL